MVLLFNSNLFFIDMPWNVQHVIALSNKAILALYLCYYRKRKNVVKPNIFIKNE